MPLWYRAKPVSLWHTVKPVPLCEMHQHPGVFVFNLNMLSYLKTNFACPSSMNLVDVNVFHSLSYGYGSGNSTSAEEVLQIPASLP